MESYDKGFYMYCNGSTLQQIADKHANGKITTVKTWMTRYHWKIKREECKDENGNIIDSKVRSFIRGKGNLQPVRTTTPTNTNTVQDIVNNNPAPVRDDFKAYIKEVLTNSVRYFDIAPVSSDYECHDRIIEYFRACQDEGMIPTIQGLWSSLGICKDTYYSWLHGKMGTVRQDYLQRASNCIQEFNTQLAMVGKMPQILYMFISKNFYGMRDQVDTVITHNDPLGERRDTSKLLECIDSFPDAEDVIDVDFDED